MATKAPAPPPTATTHTDKVKHFLSWAFLISVAIHLAFGPILGNYKPAHSSDKDVEKVSMSRKVKVVVPTPPPPTPTPPPPTPPPKSTPPPMKQTNPPPERRLKITAVKTTSKNSASNASESTYDVKQGSQNGVPQGNVASAPPAPVAAPQTPAPPPPPTPTPRPQCENPNVEATTLQAVQPDTPEIAKQAGVTGTVQVRVSLSAGGLILGATVYKSSGNNALDGAAVAAAKQSSYAAEVSNCVKVAGDYIFRADFEGE